MTFLSLIIFTLSIINLEGCNNEEGSITLLKTSINGKQGNFNTKNDKIICSKNLFETHCYFQNKLSVADIICNENIKNFCVCNYDDNNCYEGNAENSNYILNYLFYSNNGYIFLNPNTGGQSLTQLGTSNHFQHITNDTDYLHLNHNEKKLINGKELLVGCTSCNNLKSNNNKLLKC
ncbi:hypothetical protein Mgra_00008064 [Meloidogyne graminicola]|uniref:Uncharacterized protein n=1 Tax=Meloidogyne graminicola TaxID=189291 RepID=A0A8S9ZH38_9BILA|nr:hypothetical protein Mgra_00008064 [Meloidogyne graminicola]